MTFHYARDGGNLIVWVGFTDPATGSPFDDTDVTAMEFRVLDPSATPSSVLLTTTAGSWDSAAKAWKLTWAFGANLDDKRVILVEALPTRASGIAAALTPEIRERVDVTDVTQRQDEIDVDVDALQSDFNSFETVNQNEHDTTQSAVAQIGAAANAMLVGPENITRPDSGSITYKLRFYLRDLDASPAVLTDPDSNQVDVTAENQNGAAPAGVTLAGTPAGRLMRVAQGTYELTYTVDPAAAIGDQVLFEATWAKGGITDRTTQSSVVQDTDPQLGRIEDAVNDLPNRVWDEPIADHLAAGSTGKTLRDAAEDTVDVAAVADAVWNEGRAAHQTPGTFGETAIHVKEARDAVLHTTYGLEALNTDLDALLARLGVDDAVTLHQKLGALTATENLKAILGDLSTSKRLGQILGAFTEAENLKTILGAFTGTQNLKAILGAYTAASTLKAALDAHEAARDADAEAVKSDVAAIVIDIAAHRTEVEPELDQVKADTTTDIPAQLAAHDTAVVSRLDDATSGLSALHAIVDAILARMGLTTDTGGTTTTGSLFAKLNKVLDNQSVSSPPDVEWPGVEPT